MRQNVYDDPDFYAAYQGMRAEVGVNDLIEIPAMRSLLDSSRIAGARVLDLGCGAGDLLHELLSSGVQSAVGVELSTQMTGAARRRLADFGPAAAITNLAIEDYQADAESFELVVSSMAFHYVADLPTVIERIGTWLSPGGRLVFSVRHPILTSEGKTTATAPGGSIDYLHEGARLHDWFISDVLNSHLTTATIVNAVIDAGLRIERLLEPALPEGEAIRRPEFAFFDAIPLCLVVAAMRPSL